LKRVFFYSEIKNLKTKIINHLGVPPLPEVANSATAHSATSTKAVGLSALQGSLLLSLTQKNQTNSIILFKFVSLSIYYNFLSFNNKAFFTTTN
jgi:hypothetical protein